VVERLAIRKRHTTWSLTPAGPFCSRALIHGLCPLCGIGTRAAFNRAPLGKRDLWCTWMFLGLTLFLAGSQAAQATDQLRADLFRRVNDLRAKEKVAALVRNAKLDAAAQKHAENMAKQDKVSDDEKNGHVLDGKTPKQRADAEGYQSRGIGENVAMIFGINAGPKGVEKAVQLWVNSPPHYKNMMDAVFDETGIGLAQSKSGKWYYCQMFGRSK
jgi:uncharacterized protein YkwD